MEEKILKNIKRIFWLMVIAAFTFLVVGTLILPSESDEQAHKCEDLDVQWLLKSEDGEQKVEVPGKFDIDRGEIFAIEAVLPHYIREGEYLCFITAKQDMKIYIDGELRESYSTINSRPFGKSSVSAFLFLELESEDENQTIRVEMVSDSDYAGVVQNVYYGDKMGICMHLFMENGLETIMAIILLIIGIISIVICIIIKMKFHRKAELEYLSWAIVLAAMWILAKSKIRQLFFYNISVADALAIFAIILLPIPIMLYFNSVQKNRYRKRYIVICSLAILDMLVCTTLQVLNIRDLSELDILFVSVIIAGVILLIINMLCDIKKGYLKEYLLAAYGFVGFLFTTIIQIIVYYNNAEENTGAVLSVGLVFLIVMAILKAIKDAYAREKEKQDAIRSSEMKAQFLANMSHEIRTPINAILGMDEIILRESHEDNTLEYALDIRNAGQSLLALINDILDFSKIESGKMQIIDTEYEVLSLVNDSYNMIAMRAKEKGLELKVVIEPDIPAMLYGDEIRLRQIMINLLTNAVKYTPTGSVILRVGGKRTEDGQFLLRISVEDTGMGISKESQKMLFNSFQRVDIAKNRHIEGTGLGLNIVKSLLDLMGGTVSVESEVDKGSVFTVELPQKIISDQPVGDISLHYEKQIERSNYKENFTAPDARILIVDDVRMNLKVIKSLLKRTRMQIDLVESGKECLECIQETYYDIIFLDHMMPGMDGVETLEEMKKMKAHKCQNTPVVMLTANAIMGAREQYLEYGFDDYISKPVEQKKLEEVILKLLPEQLVRRDDKSEEVKEDIRIQKQKMTGNEGSKLDADEVAVAIETEEVSEESDILQKFGFLDIETGLTNSGDDEELYLEVLEMFVEPERVQLIKELFEKQDWLNYRIEVHALKGSARTIGAIELSEMAKEIELAVKDGHVEVALANHEECVREYERHIEMIAKALGMESAL